MDQTLSRVLEMHIPADARYISLVRRGIRSLAESIGFPREDVADVEVAVSEAVTNSVEHGSTVAHDAAVIVKCRASDDCLVVEVEDQSSMEKLPTYSESIDTACERGRGIMMMRTLMDECEDCRTDHGMRVTMAKQKGSRPKVKSMV